MKKPLREKLCAPLGNRLWAAYLAFFIFSLISPPAPALAERMSDGFDPGTVLPAVYSTTTLHASDFYGRNSDTPLEIPGVSRLMTLYLAVERLSADEQIPISRVAAQYDKEAPEQGEMVLLAGDRVPLRFLLLKMLFENSDTAAVAIAEKISGSQDAFLDEMQKSATTLGMTRTVFHAVDIRKTEEDAGLPPEITEAISLYDDYMQSDEHTALVLPESRTAATASTSLRDLARLMTALMNNARAKALLEVTDELFQIISGGELQVAHLRSPAAHFITLSENRITASYLLLSDRYSLLCSSGTSPGNIPVMTLAVSLRKSSLSQPTLQLHAAIDDFYTVSPLTRQGEKYPGAPEKAANGELFNLVYLDAVNYVHPKSDHFLEQKLEYLGNAPYPIPVQKGVMTGQVVFTLKDGVRIHVRVGSDQDILAKSNVLSRALQQMMRNPNLAYTIIGLSVMLGLVFLFIILRESVRLRYWLRIQRMERTAREARAISLPPSKKR